MRHNLIAVYLGIFIATGAGLCSPIVPGPGRADGLAAVAAAPSVTVRGASEAFYFTDAVSLRMREITAGPVSRGGAGDRPDEGKGGHDAFKLAFGAALAAMMAFWYWVSPAYAELYDKLFGRLSDFN